MSLPITAVFTVFSVKHVLFIRYSLMKNCWAHRAENRPRFRVIVDILSKLYERMAKTDSNCSDTESDEEDGSSFIPMSSSHRPSTDNDRYVVLYSLLKPKIKGGCVCRAILFGFKSQKSKGY